MSLLTPLGLLGLAGIIALIIIYIIKPNYQTKYISSTYVWKLSLKYKRKKIPLNTLRNILLFICQVLIITATAFILAQPFLDTDEKTENGDTIIIIDASASMQADTREETRFERAANMALDEAKEALDNGNKVSIIVASDESSFLVQQATKGQADLVYDALDQIIQTPESLYTYGTPDIDGAMKLAEQITSYTDNVTVSLYTDTSYAFADRVNVVSVVDPSEWNAAILDVRAEMVENYYRIEIDVAAYAVDMRLDVACEIMGVNGTAETVVIEKDVFCVNDETVTLVFGFADPSMPESEIERIDEPISVYSYEQIYVNVKAQDSLDCDNVFYLYGGQKPTIKVLYHSALKNDFFATALMVLKDAYMDKWNIEITEVAEGQPTVEGYDIYIFEHMVPSQLPEDGVVILADPGKIPASAGITLGNKLSSQQPLYLEKENDHPIMKSLKVEEVFLTGLTEVKDEGDFTVLASCAGYPALLVNEDVDQKMVVMPFSIHYSNLVIQPEFPLLLNNIIAHFFPVTLEDYVYEINDTVQLNARAETLEFYGQGVKLTLEELPTEVQVVTPGTYTLEQTPMSGITVYEYIYVKIPAAESNINTVEEKLVNPYFHSDNNENNIDLLFYFALALVVLLLAEWWLKSREET